MMLFKLFATVVVIVIIISFASRCDQKPVNYEDDYIGKRETHHQDGMSLSLRRTKNYK